MITPLQSRMARTALGWTVDDLAQRARVGRATVARFEAERVSPNPSTLTVIRLAFEAAGIEFLAENGLLVHKRPAEAEA